MIKDFMLTQNVKPYTMNTSNYVNYRVSSDEILKLCWRINKEETERREYQQVNVLLIEIKQIQEKKIELLTTTKRLDEEFFPLVVLADKEKNLSFHLWLQELWKEKVSRTKNGIKFMQFFLGKKFAIIYVMLRLQNVWQDSFKICLKNFPYLRLCHLFFYAIYWCEAEKLS